MRMEPSPVRARRAVGLASPEMLPSSVVYHTLEWEDVACLARAHDVAWTRANGASTLSFAVVPTR